jgi:alpha-tubulin suppressor-like RCC1 family protein
VTKIIDKSGPQACNVTTVGSVARGGTMNRSVRRNKMGGLTGLAVLAALLFLVTSVYGATPFCNLKAKVQVDGTALTGVDATYAIKVKDPSGTEFAPTDESGDTFGEYSSGMFWYSIPLYDYDDQWGGAEPGQKGCVEIYHNGTKLYMTYPAQGGCPEGSGEITVCSNSGETIAFGPGLTGTYTSTTPLQLQSSWVRLPRTGQTKCYNTSGTEITCAGTGQDGEIQAGVAWPDPRFTITYCNTSGPCANQGSDCDEDANNDVVTDNLTGLIWPRNGNPGNSKQLWNEAIDFANNFALCGYSDWHLPNVNELESLVNIAQSNQAGWLNSQGFSDVEASYYWSSTNLGVAWHLSMWYGTVSYSDKANGNYVWPVRTGLVGCASVSLPKTGQTTSYRAGDDGDLGQGVSWPSPRFTDTGNGEVADNLTGLIWTKDANAPGPSVCSPSAPKNWQGALEYVKCLNTEKYLTRNDWRLPNRKELRSLMDYSVGAPSVSPGHPFINLQNTYYYWSSNTYAYSTHYAWEMFNNGLSDNHDKIDGNHVWPVRGGQISMYALSVTKSGTGTGTVTSTPAGIDCGSTCSASFAQSTAVTLTATPVSGSTFNAWGGACTGTGTCTVTMSLPITVTATFNDVTPPTTTPSVSGGPFVNSQTITFTTEVGATIYYTLNGSTPTTSSTIYSSPIVITQTTTLKYFAQDAAGNNEAIKVRRYVSVPAGSWKALAGGTGHTLGIKTDGSLWAWGSNSHGQLGDGTTINKLSPVRIGTNADWVAVAGGTDQSLGLKSDGSLWAWGENNEGQLGDGTAIDKLIPTRIGTDTDWTSIGTGNSHSVALKKNGTLWAWGYNNEGQLGDGSTIGKHSPVQVGTDSDWISFSVASGGHHTLAIKADGTLWAWGYGLHGQTGTNTTGNVRVPTQVGTDNRWVAVSAGDQFSVGLKADGTMWTWGHGAYHQLGDGTTGDRLTPGQIATGNSWSAITAGGGHTYALRQDGMWWVWGFNVFGQLGNGTTDDVSTPVQFGSETTWATIESAHSGTLGLKSDGTLWAWGWNDSGQLGDCTTTNRYSPSQVEVCSVRLPRTGQTKCYDESGTEIGCSGTGQDGEIQAGVAWPSPRFTNPDGSAPITGTIVLDRLTGLEWARDGGTPTAGTCTGGTKTWQGAFDYVVCLNTNVYLGHNDWRLPNINELESLVNANESDPSSWLNGQGFNSVQWGGYWSSTTYANNTDNAWFVYMGHGYVYSNYKTNPASVWPVRTTQSGSSVQRTGQTTSYRTGDDGNLQQGVAWPSPRFTDQGNGEVTDNLTGLIWTKDANAPGPSGCTPGGTKDWQAALNYVKCLNTNNYLSHNDWRLPDSRELRSLVDHGRYNSALPSGHPFTSLQAMSFYWSSTTDAYNKADGWTLDMWDGDLFYLSKTLAYYVWPVRGGQVLPSNTYTLTVTKLGTGSGTATSTPPGIDCGSTCSAFFAQSTVVTLTVTPASGSAFAGWSGGGCSGTGTCSVTMSTPITVTATFVDTTPPVTTPSVAGGTFVNSQTITLTTNENATIYYTLDGTTPTTSSSTYSSPIVITQTTTLKYYAVDGAENASPVQTQVYTIATTIQLPRTGQTKCYDAAGTEITCAGTGQDGEIQAGVAWPSPRFSVTYCNTSGPCANQGSDCDGNANNDVVTDSLTGLMWPRNGNLPNGSRTWTDAVDYANNLTLCGYSDWYLSNVNQLESLIHTGQSDTSSWLNAQGFSNVQAQNYWSSTTLWYGYTDFAWFVDLAGGYVVPYNKAYGFYVWPVRVGQGPSIISLPKTGETTSCRPGDDGYLEQGFAWPSPRFTDQGNGEVTDNLTGLVWTKDTDAPGPSECAPTGTKDWLSALNYVKCLNTNSYLDHNDWRLPDRKELKSLADYGRWNKAVPTSYPFTNLQANAYWSSTTSAGNKGYAWGVDMTDGSLRDYNKVNPVFVWPVRGGQAGVPTPQYALSVTKFGNGSGTVSSAPAGIDCGSTCSASFVASTVVTLTATPGEWSAFTGWSGGGCSGTGTCLVTMDATKTITATFTLTDTTPPTGTLVINSGAEHTNSSAVTASLSCFDAESGCAQMQFSNDNTNWSVPESYGATKSWNLLSGDATKTIYVKFQDGAGNWSQVYSDTIVLDTAAPVTTPSVAGGTYNTTQTITLSNTEGATIYYTLNGADPTTLSPVYSSPIAITGNTTLKYRAQDQAGNLELVKTQTYIIDTTPPAGDFIDRLAKTGQTTSYAAGDDGALQKGMAWPNPRFTNPDESTPITGTIVLDRLTGLEWSKDGGAPNVGGCTGGMKTWQQALDYVACLNSVNYLNRNDWRLPNRVELESLVNANEDNNSTWLKAQGFSNVQPNNYWTSTYATFDEGTDGAWLVDVWFGAVYNDSVTGGAGYVWPVRGGQNGSFDNSAISLFRTGQITSYAAGDDGALQKGMAWPNPRFANPDESTPITGTIVLDRLTGLEWPKDGGAPTVGGCTGGMKTWQQALDYVACLNSVNYLNRNDWRLPNRVELESLVNANSESLVSTWLNVQGFSNVQPNRYWTSTSPISEYFNFTWFVDMSDGSVGYGDKTSGSHVWPVRRGQNGSPGYSGVSVLHGAEVTNNPSVVVQLAAFDVNGVSEMSISNDGSTWTTSPYTTTASWTLAPGDGTKTVYAKFKDAAGNWSQVHSDTIILDTSGPSANPSQQGGTFVNSRTITLTTEPGATIYYTLDGSPPTTSSLVYSSAIVITRTTTLKFFAVDAAGNNGPIYSETYTRSDFTINSEDLKLVRGETVGHMVALVATGGYSATVHLSHTFVGGAPTDATVTVTPDSIVPTGDGAQVVLQFVTNSSALTGTYTLRIAGTGGSLTRTKDITVEILPTLSLTTTTLPPGTKNQPYGAAIHASGGIAPYTFAKTGGSLPAGVALLSSGILTGTSTERGTYDFTVQVQDSAGHTAIQSYQTRVYDPTYRYLVLDAASWTVEKSLPWDFKPLPITVSVFDDYGQPFNVPSNAPVRITSNSTTGRFSLDGITYSSFFQPSIPQGFNAVVDFVYKDTTVGTFTITAQGVSGTPSQGWQGTSHLIIVTAPELWNATLTVNVTNATYGQGVTITGTLKDASTQSPIPSKVVYFTFTAPSGVALPTEYQATTNSNGQYSFVADPTVIDAAGQWSVRATFKNDSAYNDTYQMANFTIAKATTSIILALDSGSISPTGTVGFSGILLASTATPVNLSGTAILVDFTEPNGSTVHTVQVQTYDTSGHFQGTFNDFDNSTGLWAVEARLADTQNLLGSQSTEKQLTVASSAGYAILIQGDYNTQYQNNYSASLDDIYSKLLKRSIGDDNIYYLVYPGSSHETGIQTDGNTSKANIQTAITQWAKQRILDLGLAPLFIVMMNHGSPGEFHIGTETLTPAELNGWITTLENEVQAQLGTKPDVIVINGSCYSGSFIPGLSKQGRVIITSAAADQESAQGPVVSETKIYGEYFIYYLFSNLARGSNLMDAFKDAAKVTHQLRACQGQACGTNATSQGTNSRQTPLLDDNGDGEGSWMNVVGQEDGEKTANLYLGLGTNPVTLTWNQVAPTSTILLGSPPPMTYGKLQGTAATSWVEVRKPSYVMPDTGGTGQVMMNLPKITGTYSDGSARWEYVLAPKLPTFTGLDEPGTYTVYYYAMDTSLEEDILPPAIGTVYVNVAGNQAPAVPTPATPAQGGDVTSRYLTFSWNEVADPEGDAVTYSVRIYEDTNGSKGTEIKRYELIPQGAFFVDGSTEKRADGTPLFVTNGYYHWDVEALDNKGATNGLSVSHRFRTTFTNALSGMLYGYITNATTKNAIVNVSVSAGGLATQTLSNGYFLLTLSGGFYTVNVAAGGYTASSFSVSIPSGQAVSKNHVLTAAGYPMDLGYGWNFISFPVAASTPVATLLSDISANVVILWGYDNAHKQWRKYRGGDQDTLITVDPGMGYWLFLDAPRTLMIPGGLPNPPAVSLSVGWNLTGYGGVDTTPVITALTGIPWDSVWYWAANQWYFRHPTLNLPAYQPLNDFTPWKAYWIRVNGIGEWNQ